MPAIISIPFVYLFGKEFPQQYIAHAIGAGIAALTVKLSLLIKKDQKLAIWSGLLVGLSSIIWYLSSVGSVWYLGQITAAFFLLAAMVESISKKRLTLIGIFLGAAYLSRLHTILSLPFFLFLMKDKIKIPKHLSKLIFPLLIFIGFDAIYNFVRFGVPWNEGYFLIPGILSEPWFSKGIIHPSYIIGNLKTAFLSLPIFLKTSPYIQPSWAGLAIWITTPAFILSLKAPWKDKLVRYSWISILLIFLVISLHGSTGFAQFGYRFAVDFYPFLIFLTILATAKTGLKKHHWLLLIIGIIINLWGVVWINKFGWVSY